MTSWSQKVTCFFILTALTPYQNHRLCSKVKVLVSVFRKEGRPSSASSPVVSSVNLARAKKPKGPCKFIQQMLGLFLWIRHCLGFTKVKKMTKMKFLQTSLNLHSGGIHLKHDRWISPYKGTVYRLTYKILPLRTLLEIGNLNCTLNQNF
jgi:hypothetical protein